MTEPVQPVREATAHAFADANATPPFLDFVGLDPLRHTYAAEAAINQGVAFLRGALGTD
jgi:hypothetical protein